MLIISISKTFGAVSVSTPPVCVLPIRQFNDHTCNLIRSHISFPNRMPRKTNEMKTRSDSSVVLALCLLVVVPSANVKLLLLCCCVSLFFIIFVFPPSSISLWSICTHSFEPMLLLITFLYLFYPKFIGHRVPARWVERENVQTNKTHRRLSDFTRAHTHTHSL